MPLKKKIHASTTCTAKSKRNFAHKDKASGAVDRSTKPLVSALKENNRCLAAALDESRHEYRLLQDNFLKLQRERQKLLERVASLESQLVKQDSLLFNIHVQPTLQLLEQAGKDINYAKHYLKQLFIQDPSIIGVYDFPPEYFSPIEDLPIKQPSNDIERSEAFTGAKIACEAERSCANNKIKAVYPKTPHPGLLKSPQLSSTPCIESEATKSPVLTCSPRAISFEDSVQSSGDVSITSRKHTKQKVTESCNNARVSPIEGSQAGAGMVEHSDDVVVSPGLPKDEDLRAESDDLPSDSNKADRPRRRCTSFNISYQEPSLNRKLRRGDPFTSENTGFQLSEKAKTKAQRNNQKIARSTLKDVTNKKQ